MLNQIIAQTKALMYAGMVLGAIKYHLYLTSRPITYVALAKVLGMFSGGKVLSEALGNITLLNLENNEPLYSAAVVGSKTGIPGDGFFKFARGCGLAIPATDEGEYEFWCEQVRKLGYDPNNWVPQTVRPMLYIGKIQVSENLFFVLNTLSISLFQRLSLLAEEGLIPVKASTPDDEMLEANLTDYNKACSMLEEDGKDYDLMDAINEFRSLKPEHRAHLLRTCESLAVS